MQKARRLMDDNSVSFQMSLILLSSITLGSEKAKFPCSKKVRVIHLEACFVLFLCTGEYAQKPKFGCDWFMQLFDNWCPMKSFCYWTLSNK